MLRTDDDITDGALRLFEARATETSDAMRYAAKQRDEDTAVQDSEHRSAARDWLRAQGLGDALPSPEDYDYARMIADQVFPQKDGAGRVPLPPNYWKPGRLLVNGVDLSNGQRILSSTPFEDRVLGLAPDEDAASTDVHSILSQTGSEHMDELPPTQRRTLESWMEHHGVQPPGANMLAMGGRGNTRPNTQTDFDQPAIALWDALSGALKGATAQTLGLPGDLESLVRLLTGGEQVMPTTEDMEKRLPPVVPPTTSSLVTGTSPRDASVQLGERAGEFGGLGKAPSAAAGVVKKAVKKGASVISDTAKAAQ